MHVLRVNKKPQELEQFREDITERGKRKWDAIIMELKIKEL